MADGLTYKNAGVDIDAGNRLVTRIKEIARQTPRSHVMDEIGGFGGLYALNLANIDNPVLVSSADGVGTKIKIAVMTDCHDTIGEDLVAMCVNDIAVQGAKPMFFLDYLSMGTLNVDTAAVILKGIAEGCRQAQCALIGGETAEMPDTYQPGDYDLAGFAVGIVDNNKIIDGTEIRVGHRLIRIPSSGLHSNGYSLVRKICFEINDFRLDQTIPELECTLREELLRPTRIYTEIVQKLIRDLPIHGLAHITGGGIAENVIRIIPSSCGIVVYENAWEPPPIFQFLREAGGVSHTEMLRTFNNGVGFVAVVPESAASDVLNRLEGMKESACVIGEVVECKDPQQRILWSRM